MSSMYVARPLAHLAVVEPRDRPEAVRDLPLEEHVVRHRQRTARARDPGRRCRSRASARGRPSGSPPPRRRRRSGPQSGRWKPVRILISVDLPAPLSPTRPSTSPLAEAQRDVDERRRPRRSASRRARRGSRRRRARVPALTAASRGCVSRATWTFAIIEARIARPDDQVERERADADDVEAVRRMIRTATPMKAPMTVPDAAEERGAADHRAGDGQEHQVGAALQRHDRRDAGRVEDPGEAREQVREDEVADLDPADVDAALRGARSGCRRWRTVQSPQRVQVQDRLHDEDEPERPEELAS